MARAPREINSTSPALSTFDPQQPWNAVIKDSVGQMASEFWDEELKEPCRQFMMKRGPAKVKEDHGGGNPDKEVWKPHLKQKGGGKGQDKGGGKGQDKNKKNQKVNGKFLYTDKGKPLCFDWNNGKCKDKGCPNSRAHMCQWCRGQHRASNCPKKSAGWGGVGGGSEPVGDDKEK